MTGGLGPSSVLASVRGIYEGYLAIQVVNHGWLSIHFYGAYLVFWELLSLWLCATMSHLDCAHSASLRDAIDAVFLRYVTVVPANGCSRAHVSYCEWQLTLDPRRQPHVNVPEVVGDEIPSPQGHEED